MKKLTKVLLLALLLLTIPVLSACGQDKKEVTIKVLSSSYNDGTVKGGTTYKEEDIATLVASANSGKSFVAWVRNNKIVSTEESFSFKVTTNHGGTYTAVFKGDSPTYIKPIALAFNASSLKPNQELVLQSLNFNFAIENDVQTFNLHTLKEIDFDVSENPQSSGIFDFDSEYLLRLRSDYENRNYTFSVSLSYTFGQILTSKTGFIQLNLSDLIETNEMTDTTYYQSKILVKDANLSAEVYIWFAPAGAEISVSELQF